MKKIWECIKKSWQIILGIFLWLFICFFIYFQSIYISDAIQAWAIVTLVFITLYYAWQTQRLVKQQQISLTEDKNKREADFWLGRLKEYYLPQKFNLTQLMASITFKPFNLGEFAKNTRDIINILGHNQYLVTQDLADSSIKLLKLLVDNFRVIGDRNITPGLINSTIEIVTKTIHILDDEIKLIENKLIKVYGFFTMDSIGILKLSGEKGPIKVIESENNTGS